MHDLWKKFKKLCKLSRDVKTKKGVKRMGLQHRLLLIAAKVVVKACSFRLENVDEILQRKCCFHLWGTKVLPTYQTTQLKM